MNNTSVRKLNKLACLAAVALAMPAASMAANVLTNAGFETDAVLNASVVYGATGWTPSGNVYTASANGDPVRTGIGSLKCDGLGGFGVPLVSQTFPTTPGAFWNFEGYMLTPSTLPGDATFGLLKIVWMDAGNVELQPGSAVVGGANNGANPGIESTPFLNSVSATNTWIFTRAAGYAPAGATQVRLIPLFVDQSAGVGYFDDLLATNLPPVGPPPVIINYPTNSAPNPTNSPASVLSMYNSGGVFTDTTIDTWYTFWSGNPGGNADYFITNSTRTVKKYLGMGYAGVEFVNVPINSTNYNTLHVDVWTPNANQFGIQLVSLDPNTQAAQVDLLPASGKITTNNWVSLNIPLSQFKTANPNTDFANLKQLLWIDNQGGGGYVNGNFYIDNVYFYTAAAAATPVTLINPAVGGGNFTAQSASQTGFNYILQATAALGPASWANVQTNAGTGGTLNYSVPIVPGSPQRFYRVQVQ